ncbi:hypothetical protein SS1G_03491 [Sclerotinia sclerotiorum 1980 UF-70]|uniref:PH domain-containing protein n=2 Tax=Sclerotinia sclerotiorum (strain ATCC 18683 / 1980 / Ss-1) TaxID=665079 RepID=A7EDV1_SCLS1|nr:hypothetical protein SS1G_03491 [Sclerotinia sclerotiorum 1980 UF-70]APA10851.1 hypothetical protein sscle_07g056210 [Sclerotinia sclerotiorum 1980 UF-70]EDO01017.1 hypothetical protein SS1G_03491 [Sclerotinia sclerotiorum 1980 UF-70]
MTSLAAKYISKKLLGESVANKFGSEDLYFETVPASRLDGVPSKKKTQRRRKAIPAGISEKDAKILTKVKRRAYRLDMSLFNFCGIRFGWSSVIGLVPAIGDFIDLFMAMMVLRTCNKVDGGLPNGVKSKMMFNIMLDFAVGLIPFAGDLVDAVFRANTRNALELERHLRDKGAKILKAKGEGLPAVDVTDPHEFDLYDEQLSDEEPPRYTSGANEEPVSPREPGGRNRNSWFGYGGKAERTRQPDPEQGRRSDRSQRTRQPDPEQQRHSDRSQRTRQADVEQGRGDRSHAQEPPLPVRPKKVQKSGRR